jgi:hypothetical protein
MPAGDDNVTKISAALGALAACAGAVAAWAGVYVVNHQIGAATSALHANNSYLVHKDIVDAYDRLLAAKDEVKFGDSKDAKSQEALTRAALKFDGLIETAEALRNNDGITSDTWQSILVGLCPSLTKSSGDALTANLSASTRACSRYAALWQNVPK